MFPHLFTLRGVMETALDIFSVIQNEKKKKFVYASNNFEIKLPHGNHKIVILPI